MAMRASAATNRWAAHGWAADGLGALKRQIAAIEGAQATCEDTRALPLGITGVDAALGGGLRLGATHEIAPASPLHRGATFAFALGLACQACKHGHADTVVWIETPLPAGLMASASRALGLRSHMCSSCACRSRSMPYGRWRRRFSAAASRRSSPK